VGVGVCVGGGWVKVADSVARRKCNTLCACDIIIMVNTVS